MQWLTEEINSQGRSFIAGPGIGQAFQNQSARILDLHVTVHQDALALLATAHAPSTSGQVASALLSRINQQQQQRHDKNLTRCVL